VGGSIEVRGDIVKKAAEIGQTWLCGDFLTAKRQLRIVSCASASGGVGKNKIGGVGKNKIAWGLSQAILFGC